MEALDRLRARIGAFPGYDTDADRRLSDELVRSYLGEAVAELAARNPSLEAPMRQRIDALLLRLGFASQRWFPAHAAAIVRHGVDSAVVDADAAVIELADRAASVPGDGVAAYLDEVDKALDRRDATMQASAVRT
ncbi:MAG: hypothetical protein JO030_02255 [Candidatus Eremiobacteraeota bacterium]|nr:hypothetical protein [Candidatus Eremiobacteraeota bacterium]